MGQSRLDFYAQRRSKDAEQAFVGALKVLDPMELETPTPGMELPSKYQQVRQQALNNVGNLYRDDARLADAESAFRQALAIKEQLAETFPSVPQFRQELREASAIWASSSHCPGNRPMLRQRLRNRSVSTNGWVPSFVTCRCTP